MEKRDFFLSEVREVFNEFPQGNWLLLFFFSRLRSAVPCKEIMEDRGMKTREGRNKRIKDSPSFLVDTLEEI